MGPWDLGLINAGGGEVSSVVGYSLPTTLSILQYRQNFIKVTDTEEVT